MHKLYLYHEVNELLGLLHVSNLQTLYFGAYNNFK